jgi:hypothetical protein
VKSTSATCAPKGAPTYLTNDQGETYATCASISYCGRLVAASRGRMRKTTVLPR